MTELASQSANNETPASSEALTEPESRTARAKRLAKEGARVLAVAALKIVTRTLAWGAFGLVLGIVVWSILYGAGLLEIAWEPWSWVVWILLALYALLGAGGLGYVGSWRGLGRTVIYVGVERGLVVLLVDKILDKLAGLMDSARRSSSKVDGVVDVSHRFVENLPLQQWEERLKKAVQTVLTEEDEAASGGGLTRAVARRIRKFIVLRIEKYLLALVRKEIDEEGSGGGVSIGKVRELALAQIEAFFADFIEGLMRKKLLLGLIILIVVYAIAPIVACFI